MSTNDTVARGYAALRAYGLPAASMVSLPGGLINRTFLVTHERERFVLQWVNPIFGPLVHHDIDAVTTHLADHGMLTMRVLPTRRGELYVSDSESGCWRLLSYVDGQTHNHVSQPFMCRSAGALVGRFHRVLSTMQYRLQHQRPHVHDTPHHFRYLREVLATRQDHRNYAEVAVVAREILARGADLPTFGGLPARVVHGDLKISNLLFSNEGEAIALVDFDTLATMTIPVELGDAWRSWCNPLGEDAAGAVANLSLLAAAAQGYASTAQTLLTPREVQDIPLGVETITLELASRFCADALDETYFGWNHERFASASEHNLLRARSQLALACSLNAAQREIARLVSGAFESV